MPKLKTLAGKEVVGILISFGFAIEKQKGSHVKLVRHIISGKQVIGVPLHSSVDKGTLKAIYNQILKYISEEELRDHFYTN